MRDFQKFGKAGISVKEMEKRRSDLREKLDQTGKKISVKPDPRPVSNLKPKDLSIGDSVKVLSMNLKGTVSTLPGCQRATFSFRWASSVPR